MKNTHINEEELNNWELEQIEKVRCKIKDKVRKNPKENKQKNKKKRELSVAYFYRHEEKENRKFYQKTFRSKWKKECKLGNYHIPKNKEYKTYGYITW